MKAKKTTEITITLNKEIVTQLLEKDKTYNWLIEKGANMIINGERPGNRMIDFLESLDAITIQKD